MAMTVPGKIPFQLSKSADTPQNAWRAISPTTTPTLRTARYIEVCVCVCSILRSDNYPRGRYLRPGDSLVHTGLQLVRHPPPSRARTVYLLSSLRFRKVTKRSSARLELRRELRTTRKTNTLCSYPILDT